MTAVRRLLQIMALAVLCASSRAQSPAGSEDPTAIAASLDAVHSAGSVCDWPTVAARADVALRVAPRASEAWLEASAWDVTARYELWQPDEIERRARDMLAAVAELRRAEPLSRRSALGPLHPLVAGHVAEATVSFARLLQARGHHADALGHLRLLLDDIHAGPLPDAARLQRSAQLEAARSLMALGRHADAGSALRSLCGAYPGTRETATASAILQEAFDGPRAYSGKFREDAAVRERMQAVRSALPTARRRLAERLGWKEEEIPRVPLGFSDMLPELRGVAAITEGDPRRPNVAPVIVVFTEPLALDLTDPEVTLVHELGHAALMIAIGPAYGRLPAWLCEGLCEALAGQHEQSQRMLLDSHLADDPVAFCAAVDWTAAGVHFAEEPCAPAGAPCAGLALEPFVSSHGIEGVRALIAALRAGTPWESAFRELTGVAASEYLSSAHTAVLARLEARRVAAVPQVQAVLTLVGDPKARLEAVARVVGAPASPSVLGFALWQRGGTLAALGRHGEALDAYRELIGRRRDHPSWLELARAREAEALLALGRKDEARHRLEALRRESMIPNVAGWVEQELSRLK